MYIENCCTLRIVVHWDTVGCCPSLSQFWHCMAPLPCTGTLVPGTMPWVSSWVLEELKVSDWGSGTKVKLIPQQGLISNKGWIQSDSSHDVHAFPATTRLNSCSSTCWAGELPPRIFRKIINSVKIETDFKLSEMLLLLKIYF